MDIAAKIASELQIRNNQAEAAIKLIDEGNTIPFISRYRKEATGALNDEQLRKLFERLNYLRNLEDRKSTVLSSIEEQGKLTAELKKQIESAETMVAVEDLYRPYKQKKRTRATIAKERGLSGLASIISLQMTKKTLEDEAKSYIDAEKTFLILIQPFQVPLILSQRKFPILPITEPESAVLHSKRAILRLWQKTLRQNPFMRCTIIFQAPFQNLQATVFLPLTEAKKKRSSQLN